MSVGMEVNSSTTKKKTVCFPIVSRSVCIGIAQWHCETFNSRFFKYLWNYFLFAWIVNYVLRCFIIVIYDDIIFVITSVVSYWHVLDAENLNNNIYWVLVCFVCWICFTTVEKRCFFEQYWRTYRTFKTYVAHRKNDIFGKNKH